MSNTVITSNGTNFVTSAFTQGTLIAIKYFLPVYDWRIDPYITNNNIPVSAISAVAEETVGLTSPYGEVIWNRGTQLYSLSSVNNNLFIISAGGESIAGTTVVDSKQTSSPQPTNLYNNYPISNQFSGTSIVPTATLGVWDFDPDAPVPVTGNNLTDFTDKSQMFGVTDYVPVKGDDGSLKGQFFCKISQEMGTFKFNKISMFVMQYDSNGSEIGNPSFFAEAYMNYPEKKTFLDDGFNLFNFEIQITLSASGGLNPSQVFYGASADYWVKVPNGMHSSEKISIGVFTNTNSEPEATLHIGRTTNELNVYEDKPQIRIEGENETDNTDEFKVDIRVVGESESDRSCYIKVSANSDDIYLIPDDNASLSIGDYNNPIKSIEFLNKDYSLDDYIAYRFINTADQYVNFYRNGLFFYDNHLSSATQHNVIYGVDLVREDNKLVIQTKNDNIYILAGASNYALSTDDQYNRHEYNIFDVDNVTELTSTNWNFSASTNIVARGGIKTFGPLELNYVPKNGTVGYWTGAVDWGVMSTKKTYMGIVAGLKLHSSYSTYEEVYDALLHFNIDNLYNPWNPVGEYIKSDSILFLQAGEIRYWGNLLPQYNTASPYHEFGINYSLGNSRFKFREISTERINIDTYEIVNSVTYEEQYNILFGLRIDRTKTLSTRETSIFPNNSELVYFGLGSDPITEINASTINVPNKFIADSNGVYIPVLTATTANIINGYFDNLQVTNTLTATGGDLKVSDDIFCRNTSFNKRVVSYSGDYNDTQLITLFELDAFKGGFVSEGNFWSTLKDLSGSFDRSSPISWVTYIITTLELELDTFVPFNNIKSYSIGTVTATDYLENDIALYQRTNRYIKLKRNTDGTTKIQSTKTGFGLVYPETDIRVLIFYYNTY